MVAHALSISVGAHTLPGNRYGDLNQDTVATQEMYTAEELKRPGAKPQCYVAAVLDGHGLLGEQAAQQGAKTVARDLLFGRLRTQPLALLTNDQLQTLMKDAFRKAHGSVLSLYDEAPARYVYPVNAPHSDTYQLTTSSHGLPLYRSSTSPGVERMLEFGATATVAIVQGNKLVVANAGDSAAVLGHTRPNRHYDAQVITAHHGGKNPDEVERLERDFSGKSRILPEDGYISITDGPYCGYELAVTRSLGHKALQHNGVIAEPFVGVHRIEAHHCCAILASDGVWDEVTHSEAVALVMRALDSGRTAQQAAEALVAHAVEMALDGPDCDADNTSAVVIAFKHAK